MLKQICDILTALRAYIKQTHLLAHSKGYGAHLLLNDLYERVDEDIDRLKELALAFGAPSAIAYAEESLKGALPYTRLYQTEDFTQMLKNCVELERTADDAISRAISFYKDNPAPFVEGVLNALGDLDERRLHEVYLLNTELLHE